MGRPNKGSSLTEKAFDNYSSSDYLAGFENGGSTHKYNIANVSKYALEKQSLSAGGKNGTVKSIIDGLTPRIKKTEDDIAAFETTVAQAEAAVTELSGRVNAMESGPLVAATASAMVDTTRIYVYTGEELGMTAGDWYYHNGSAWVSGGVYNAVAVNTDDTLSVEDVPADAKAVGDALEAMDEQKANVDGVYESMTVGNAEQLIGSVFTEDSVPYNFRTAGGAIDIGDRLYDKLVGGTVAWNQLADSGTNMANWVQYGPATVSISGNVATFTATEASGGVRCLGINSTIPAGHKVFAVAEILCPESNRVLLRLAGGVDLAKYNHGLSGYETVYGMVASNGESYMLIVRNDSTTDYNVSASVRNVQIFDLTQMFGTTIADYIYNLEYTTAGAGVAWFRKLFQKPYYPYNAGELMSVQTSAHKTVGFNAFDGDLEFGNINNTGEDDGESKNYVRSNNFIHVIPSTRYNFKIESSEGFIQIYVVSYDANKNVLSRVAIRAFTSITYSDSSTFMTAENVHYIRFFIYKTPVYNAVYGNDICINLSWDGERDGEYEEYVEHVYPLDSNLTLRGIPKLDASNKLYYDGDTYESDGTVKRKYGIVDLGTLSWSEGTDTTGQYFYATISPIAKSKSGSELGNNVCSVYSLAPSTDVSDKAFAISNVGNVVYIRDSAYSTTADFKTAMSGVYLVYELAEPTEETAAPYQNPQVVDDFGTEEYVDSRTVPIPVGHETKYANNLRAKLEMAPDSPDGSGDYIVRQTNGQNEYVPLVIPKELPNTPSEDGIYHLKVTVVNGAAGLSWESEA